MKSRSLRFFGGLDRSAAEPPSFFWIRTRAGTKTVSRGERVLGSEMAASWLITSFQDAKGWERFDIPWFISLQKRPASVSLSSEGLRIEFSGDDTGYVFSMPLYGYGKLPQRKNNFTASHNLPSLGVQPWKWTNGLPADVVNRCNWWARVAKAFPVGFQESFSIDPGKDEITFRQDYRWLMVGDDWATPPLRFATLSPSVGLAWKFPGFPMTFSAPIHDPGYFTAFGPLVGAVDTDRIEISMRVLKYMHELEWLSLPQVPAVNQQQALDLITAGLKAKFPNSWKFVYDHGSRENFCWNIVGDVWYPRALPFVTGTLSENTRKSLGIYMRNDVLRPHFPYHGKYILHGPGVGSWGEWGDAGKFMTTALQTVWAYGQFADGWPLIRERWPLIKRYFITPEEADWVSFGRYASAEIGDEAGPCSAYARMAWVVGDLDEYLLGAYMFSRELIHLYVKQRAGRYFYEHQPYNQYQAMPAHIYPTDLWGSTRGWQVDGPTWGHLSSGEHQSANRWVRFQDPDVGRFYRELLSADVEEELDWYEQAGRGGRTDVYRVQSYQEWLRVDNPHILPSLLRLHSFLVNAPLQPRELLLTARPPTGWGASDIAVGYALLRKLVPLKHLRLVSAKTPPSPYVLGLQRIQRGGQVLNTVQDIRGRGLALEPRWHGWGVSSKSGSVYLSFGSITGDFGGKVAGAESDQWISPGCRVAWADGITPRRLGSPQSILRDQDRTPVAIIGPFSNSNDREITETVYPPEKEFDLGASYTGLAGLVTWQTTTLGSGRLLDLTKVLSGPWAQGALAYAAQLVWSPEEMDVYLLAKHQGGIIAWINDKEIIRFHGVHRPSGNDAVKGLGRLQPGWNKILLKLESMTGDCTFQFRIVHLDRLPIPALKFSDHIPAAD